MSPNYPDPTAIDSKLDCAALEALIPDYAFGLTDQAQTQLVEANLNDCAEAITQLADFRRIQAEMREAVPQIAPPADLEARLMAAIQQPEQAALAAATVMPFPSKPPRRANRTNRFNPMWAVAGIAAVAILALVITNVFWVVRFDELSRRQNELAAQVKVQVSNPSTTGAVNSLIVDSTSGLHWVRLPGSKSNADSSAFLMWNAQSKIGLMYAHALPQLPSGQVYQLWLTRGEERVSGGTFEVDAQGKAALLFNCVEPIDKYTWARITIEPKAGSGAPTGVPIVIGQLGA